MKKLLLFSLFFFSFGVMAQEISITQKQAAASVPFAQPFAVQYALSHSPDYQVAVDEDSLPAEFEITQTSVVKNSPATQTYDFTVIPFSLGKSTFTVTFNLTQEGKTIAQAQEPVYVEITPAKTFPGEDLREIRGPKVPDGWLTWLLAFLAAAALIWVLHLWRKKVTEEKLQITRQEDSRPGHVIALSKIDALLDSGLWEKAEYKLFYITLSDILREYLWRQFQIDASADTSAELLRRVKNMPQMAPLLYQLRDFLSSGDLVKFAQAVPNEQIRNKDVQILRELITETSPKEIIPAQEEKPL